MYRRMPVEATVERRSQLARRAGVLIRDEDVVAGLVGIFAMDAVQRQVSEPFGGGGVQGQVCLVEPDRPQHVFESRLDLVEQTVRRYEDHVEEPLGPGYGGQYVHFLLSSIGRS